MNNDDKLPYVSLFYIYFVKFIDQLATFSHVDRIQIHREVCFIQLSTNFYIQFHLTWTNKQIELS